MTPRETLGDWVRFLLGATIGCMIAFALGYLAIAVIP